MWLGCPNRELGREGEEELEREGEGELKRDGEGELKREEEGDVLCTSSLVFAEAGEVSGLARTSRLELGFFASLGLEF